MRKEPKPQAGRGADQAAQGIDLACVAAIGHGRPHGDARHIAHKKSTGDQPGFGIGELPEGLQKGEGRGITREAQHRKNVGQKQADKNFHRQIIA